MPNNSAIQQLLHQEAEKINLEIDAFFAKQEQRTKKIDRHIHTMSELLHEYVLRGGKRVRGSLVVCGYLVAGGKNTRAIYEVAGGVELFHHYLLALDDMADRDLMRHGGPSLHVQYREHVPDLPGFDREYASRSLTEIACALLAGYSAEMIRSSAFTPEHILSIQEIMNYTMLQDTAAGWLIHFNQNWSDISASTEDEYIKGLRYVTAQYTFVGPLLIGATLANASNELKDALRAYGRHLGTAFQMTDDQLGVFGDSSKTQKPVGNDLREGKKTLLVQYSYQHGTKEQRKVLETHIGSETALIHLKKLQSIFKETGAFAYVEKKAREEASLARPALITIKKYNNEIGSALESLIEFVLERTY